LTYTDFRHEVPQPFVAEDHRIHENLFFEIIPHMSSVSAPGDLPDIATDVSAPQIRRQVTAGMSAADFHAGKAVESSIENHSRQEKRRFQRVPNDISKIA